MMSFTLYVSAMRTIKYHTMIWVFFHFILIHWKIIIIKNSSFLYEWKVSTYDYHECTSPNSVFINDMHIIVSCLKCESEQRNAIEKNAAFRQLFHLYKAYCYISFWQKPSHDSFIFTFVLSPRANVKRNPKNNTYLQFTKKKNWVEEKLTLIV